MMTIDFESIPSRARELERDIWLFRGEIWPNEAVTRFDCLDPRVACQFLGVNYESMFVAGDSRFTRGKIIGELNRSARKISVSQSLNAAESRFTGAHEVGHWLLHKSMNMHRERPVISRDNNTNSQRPREELEADFFAANFLMPEDLLINQFQKRFGRSPLQIDDSSAFWLSNGNQNALLRSSADSLDRHLAVARCQNFQQIRFKSLSHQFGVSDSAMAIRLKELNLIKWP